MTDDDVERAQSAFTPFSIGPRGCVGKALAMKEVMIVVGRLVWSYEMRLARGCAKGKEYTRNSWGRHKIGEIQMRDLFVGKAEGLMVELKARALDGNGGSLSCNEDLA